MNNSAFFSEIPLTNKKVGVVFDTGEAIEAGEGFSCASSTHLLQEEAIWVLKTNDDY
jgi:hypothetical protein